MKTYKFLLYVSCAKHGNS